MRNFAILIFCFIAYITIQAQDLYFKHLGIPDGLSQVCIHTIFQDEFGAVWIGTSEGLNRYNGNNVLAFPLTNAEKKIFNSNIGRISGNRNGTLYIISEGDLLSINLYTQKVEKIRDKGVYNLFCEKDTLWITCTDGIYYYTQQEKKLSLFTQKPNKITNLYIDNDTIWAINSTALYRISRKNPNDITKAADFNNGSCIFVDKKHNIWIGGWNGLYRFTPSQTLIHYTSNDTPRTISHNQIRDIIEDNYGNIWIGSFKGIDCFHPESNFWTHYTEYGVSPNTLSHCSILSLCKDIQGNIWAGTYYGGVNIFNPNPSSDYFYHADPLKKNWLNFPVTGKMAEDKKGNLWICTEGGGLHSLNRTTGKFTQYTHQSGNNQSLGSNNLKSILYNTQNEKLYIGTHLGGMYILDLKTQTGHRLTHKTDDIQSLPYDIVNEIQKYKDGLIVLTQGGVTFMDIHNEKFLPLSNDPQINQVLNQKFAYETFLIDSRERLWLGHVKGGVTSINLRNNQLTYYKLDSLKQSGVSQIFEDSQGEIYICTIGSGIFHYLNHKNFFEAYNVGNQSIPNNFCYYLCNSNKPNNLYLIHGKGLSIFNTQSGKTENTFRFFNQTYSLGSSLFKDSKGRLYISGTNGLAVIQQQTLDNTPQSQTVSFDRLFVYNQEVFPGDSTKILSHILNKTNTLDLSYNQNNITIEFSTFNHFNDLYQSFEYFLQGFDNSWNQTHGRNITYTNLPPGNYKLRLRPVAQNQSTIQEAQLNIHIAPPFYASSWAYTIYTLLTLGVILLIINFIIKQTSLRSSLKFERKEKERIEELNQLKINFFTNISHEFRTPLTLILSQLETLLQTDYLSTAIHNRILRIYKNAWNMRKLISELLDFQKQEEGGLKLKVEEHNMVSFVHQIYTSFHEIASQKEIEYHFQASTENLPVWFDELQMQKVFSNLLLNAFKYTPTHGCINIEIYSNNKDAIITVSDTGIGISEKDIQKIFNQFYQVESQPNSLTPGTGIGLSIAKNIVELHHGNITVHSTLQKGTRFTVSLPLGKQHFKEEILTYASQTEAILPADSEIRLSTFYIPEKDEEIEIEEKQEKENIDNPVLLLVEDNEELCNILKEVLQHTYQLHITHNGQEALNLAQELNPDLIISDLLLPGLSGKELCYKIKNNIELSHISIILMTGQMSVENMIESFMFGADDYIIKPFDIRVLLARCRSLLKNKKRLKDYYTHNPSVPTTTEADAISEADRKLLKKCIDIIRENFTNPEFDVMVLANHLCMGRSKLYTKFKQLVGIPPNEFILKIKLEEAMRLLKEHPEFNISEISIQLGFSSPRYFSKLYKAYFGVAPQSIRSKKEK